MTGGRSPGFAAGEVRTGVLIAAALAFAAHGGALSEGGTQGSGHTREAVHQLQRLAGDRQVEGASRALLLLGGFFFNAQGAVFRTA